MQMCQRHAEDDDDDRVVDALLQELLCSEALLVCRRSVCCLFSISMAFGVWCLVFSVVMVVW